MKTQDNSPHCTSDVVILVKDNHDEVL